MSDARASAALSYWRASRRLLRNDGRMRMSESTADLVLIDHALDTGWPRLSIAATGTLVLRRRAERAAPTSGGRSRSRARPRRRPPD